jgi:hypothetical protein
MGRLTLTVPMGPVKVPFTVAGFVNCGMTWTVKDVGNGRLLAVRVTVTGLVVPGAKDRSAAV